jgi:hypothetical protein
MSIRPGQSPEQQKKDEGEVIRAVQRGKYDPANR